MFKNIIGQEFAVSLLKKALESEKVAHAYLFLGPAGVGKSLLAAEFAKALNCEKKDAAPCDECVSCVKINKKIHPDVNWFYPEGRSSQIGVDLIRKLEKTALFKPFEGRNKVYVMDGADCMTEEAANRLLKTLEEPPEDTILILLAANFFKLIPTIVSRCQRINFFSLKEKEITLELRRRYGLDERRALCLSRFSEGSFGKAVEAVEQQALTKRDRVVDEFIAPKRLGYEDSWLYEETREDINKILDALALYFRDLLVFNLSGDPALLINSDKEDHIKRISQLYSAERLRRILEKIADTQEQIRFNANIKIALSCMRLGIT
ncbi:MAG: DNA polymerase III subunit delta' [Candidatus Omnitrophota bacterium]